jgi:hypothetical protein
MRKSLTSVARIIQKRNKAMFDEIDENLSSIHYLIDKNLDCMEKLGFDLEATENEANINLFSLRRKHYMMHKLVSILGK